MKTPNSKSEFRNPKWFDFAHHLVRPAHHHPEPSRGAEPVEGQIQNSNDPMFKTFEFRISDLFRASDLGFRISEPLNNSRGSYLVLLALMTIIFAGVGGMIFELHKSMALRTHLQNVADLAALAAAREYHDTKGEITFTRINAIIEKVAKENAHWLGKNLYYAPDLSLAEGNMMGYFRGSPLAEDEKGNWNDYEFTPFTTPHSDADAEIGGMITTVPNTQVNAVRAVLKADAAFTKQLLKLIGFEGELRAESIAQVCPDGSVALYGMCDPVIVPPVCNMNDIQDGDEIGVDCGGSVCPSCCGNGEPDESEQCDDRNAASGDGCSAVCQCDGATPNYTNGHCCPLGEIWTGGSCSLPLVRNGGNVLMEMNNAYSLMPLTRVVYVPDNHRLFLAVASRADDNNALACVNMRDLLPVPVQPTMELHWAGNYHEPGGDNRTGCAGYSLSNDASIPTLPNTTTQMDQAVELENARAYTKSYLIDYSTTPKQLCGMVSNYNAGTSLSQNFRSRRIFVAPSEMSGLRIPTEAVIVSSKIVEGVLDASASRDLNVYLLQDLPAVGGVGNSRSVVNFCDDVCGASQWIHEYETLHQGGLDSRYYCIE